MIIGGGPAGNTAATYAARLGAEVTVIERDVVGGAAHLWDCIPSKTMIATGGAMSFSRRIHGMGLEQQDAEVDIEALDRAASRRSSPACSRAPRRCWRARACSCSHGTARLSATTRSRSRPPRAPAACSGRRRAHRHRSRPRIPDWCITDGERILTTRDCYPPSIFPESITVIGSGVTGVEFVHMFSSFGAKVT